MKRILFLFLLLNSSIYSVYAQVHIDASLRGGSGFDLYKGANSLNYTNDIEDATVGFNIKSPKNIAFLLGLQFKRFGIQTGFELHNRNLKTIYLDESQLELGIPKLGIRYTQKSIPLLLDYTQPINEKVGLTIGVGFSIDWTGEIDSFNFSGAAPQTEDSNRWALVSSQNNEINDRLFLVLDEGMTAFAQTYILFYYQLTENTKLTFQTRYKHQVEEGSSISRLVLWGYDEELNIRKDGYFPRTINYRSLLFDLGLEYRF